MTDSDENDFERAQRTSKARAAVCAAAVSPELNARDDAIAAQLSHENASAKSKLGKVYRLLADFAQTAAPFVACKKGCAACCKMNVSITSVEAERLAAVSRRPMARVARPVAHELDEFAGVPCPFLVDEICSVYDARPYACRAHFSFDMSSYWCHPERAFTADMGMLELGGAEAAYTAIARTTAMGGFADIRDFFPSEGGGGLNRRGVDVAPA